MNPPCLACDLTAGRAQLPGGTILTESGWVVEHCIGPLGVGTLILKPIRHVVKVADLDAAEAAVMGPLIRRVAAAVTELCSPEQVYVTLWSHAGGQPGHIHFVIQPVSRSDMVRHDTHGPALQMAMFTTETPPDATSMAAFAHLARDWFERIDSDLSGNRGGDSNV